MLHSNRKIIFSLAILLFVFGAGVAYIAINARSDSGAGQSNLEQQEVELTNTDLQKDDIASQETTTGEDLKTDAIVNSDTSVLRVEEWGIEFDVPSGLTQVEYVILDDTVSFFALPSESEVVYRDDYKEVLNNSNGQNATYSLGNLLRSEKPSKYYGVFDDIEVQGRRIGDYYYYTAWSFSSLATGVGINEIFIDQECQDWHITHDAGCTLKIDAASDVFNYINDVDTGLLNSIRVF